MVATELSRRSQFSDAEWEARCTLAALYRILDHLRMTDLIYTHMSVRTPDDPDTLLINRYGDLFDEITASSLLRLDINSEADEGRDGINWAGFAIHSGAYRARPDVACVIHLHTRAGTAVATQPRGLLPISQQSLMVLGQLGYHDYDGPGVLEERDQVGRDCRDHDVIILRNHGLLTLGAAVPAAFKRMYYLETACQIQCTAMAGGQEPVLISDEVQRKTFALWEKRFASGTQGDREWQALLRKLERVGTDYQR
jgi:ribulose-5-phosphate 4-epimerase/fuculose-1-phosphate aldolase